MPSQPPPGEPVPASGPLTPAAIAALQAGPGRPFGWYVHVPFCTVRCGYCDFNTYTNLELGGGASQHDWAANAEREVRAAARQLQGSAPPAATLFFGGGTPSLLPPTDIGRVITTIADEFGLEPDCEITLEANPDTLDEASLAGFREAGVNRLSIGMQSAVPAVLATLDRTHDPARVSRAVSDARHTGFERISLDLIYGTPGESLSDWRTSVEAALDQQPDHISAYCLGIEAGTALHARLRRGLIAAVDEDHAADCYALADDLLESAGLSWYEISNWARPGQRSRHNLGYWRGDDWWPVGPGAHGHVRGVRWWNRRHPAAWAAALEVGAVSAHEREVLTSEQRAAEALMLGLRLADGVSVAVLPDGAAERVAALVAEGLLDRHPADPAGDSDRLVLTRRGRLLADGVTLRLLG